MTISSVSHTIILDPILERLELVIVLAFISLL